VTVSVVATDRSWVRAVADGVTVFEGFLSAGDLQTWEAQRQLTMRVGNASALSLTVNGRPVGRLGPDAERFAADTQHVRDRRE